MGYINNKPDFERALAVIWRYIAALVSKRQYTKALAEADKMLPFITQNAVLLHTDPMTISWYRYVVFKKAEALYQLKRYREAMHEFNSLKKYEPDNADIKRWAFYSWYGRYAPLSQAALYVGAFLILTNLSLNLFPKGTIPPVPRLIAYIVGLSLVAFNLWVGERLKRYKRQ
ncbi:hypothetical protein LLH06_03005 [Mucilaginibacter daejeonensis]|uniref:hypothetical protein n=1 Tax=Mucilaginibacter daejeonensis TaxID=398049 RepID=UPI001D17575D|nr:hypothetical protein [Mucilaginibacter daejeonensis]UEG53942.1 hypothetical protein LLH06_03005 [Mucilaginibacter daejeonensis]